MNPLRLLDLPLETVVAGLTGHYAAKGDQAQADCLLGFSFGYRGAGRTVTPGLSNQDLANTSIKHFAKLPKILQFEIADAYTEAGGPEPPQVLRITKHRQPHKYLDTREVAAQAKELMAKHGWKTAILLAHPHHLPRIQLVCDRLGINWVATDVLRGAVEFDPQSAQKWTRSEDRWRGYEPLALAFYRMRGWA